MTAYAVSNEINTGNFSRSHAFEANNDDDARREIERIFELYNNIEKDHKKKTRSIALFTGHTIVDCYNGSWGAPHEGHYKKVWRLRHRVNIIGLYFYIDHAKAAAGWPVGEWIDNETFVSFDGHEIVLVDENQKSPRFESDEAELSAMRAAMLREVGGKCRVSKNGNVVFNRNYGDPQLSAEVYSARREMEDAGIEY